MTVIKYEGGTNDVRGYISSIEEVIEDARNGRMVVLVDDEDRENEGDLVIPAGAGDARSNQLHGQNMAAG